jgi:hypothetical protein
MRYRPVVTLYLPIVTGSRPGEREPTQLAPCGDVAVCEWMTANAGERRMLAETRALCCARWRGAVARPDPAWSSARGR